ncbi:hypothetical protein ABT023_06545 [Micromonospora sp. NPDC002296]
MATGRERRFAPGDVVVRREILRGEMWFAAPTVCVRDSPDLPAGWDTVPC